MALHGAGMALKRDKPPYTSSLMNSLISGGRINVRNKAMEDVPDEVPGMETNALHIHRVEFNDLK